MSTRTKLEIGLVIIAVIFAGLWWTDRDARLKAEGEAASDRVEREAAVGREQASEKAREAAVTASLAREARAMARSDSALKAYRAAVVARPAVEDRAVALEPPADTAAFRRGFQAGQKATEDSEVAPLLAVHASDLDVIGELRVQLSAETTTRIDAQAALAAALAEVGALRRSAPGWTDKAVSVLKLAGAFYAGRESIRIF